MACFGCCNCCGCGTQEMTELPLFTTGVTSDVLWNFASLYPDHEMAAQDPYPCPDDTHNHSCTRKYTGSLLPYYGQTNYTAWQRGMMEECTVNTCSGTRDWCCRRAMFYRVKAVLNTSTLHIFRCRAPNPTCSSDSSDANACRYLVTGTINVTATVQSALWTQCTNADCSEPSDTDCSSLDDFPADYDTGYPGTWGSITDGTTTTFDVTRSRMYTTLKTAGVINFRLSTAKIEEQCCIDWPTASSTCKTNLKCTADPDAIITVVPGCYLCGSCTTTTLNFNVDGGDWTFTLI